MNEKKKKGKKTECLSILAGAAFDWHFVGLLWLVSTVYFSKMGLEMTVKDLQTQNSKFQETLLTLSKGQQQLMSLLVTKKKTKKKTIINMGKRFKGPVWQVQVEEDSSNEDENQNEDARSTHAGGGNNLTSEDEDYFDEQYPLAEDKYKQLENRLKVVEI